ncbi:MAG: hypothetical protein QG620_401 [Patescibacteria group bacterium]|nr:hypothetical protein [Patescibacteria group bacterium]
MKKQKNKNSISKNKLNGVSLIEVLVVIAIIAILSSVILVSLKRSLTKAEYAEAQMQLKTLTNLIAELELDTGKSLGGHPLAEVDCTENREIYFNVCAAGFLDVDECDDDENRSKDAGGVYRDDPRDVFDNWAGPYLNSFPRDPWGTNYYFDPDYMCNSGLKQKGCEGYYGRQVRAIVSFGPNKVNNYNWMGNVGAPHATSDDIVYVLCAGGSHSYP